MAVTAVVTIASQHNVQAELEVQDLTYVAVQSGAEGNDITIEYTDPGAPSSPLSVSVVGQAISVSLETDGGSALISTADDVLVAIQGDVAASALVEVALTGTGSTVQLAESATNLANGENVSLYNERVMALVTLTNGGVDDVEITDMRGVGESLIMGQWGPPITPVVIPASESIVETIPVIAIAPQIAGGPSTEPSSYSVGCRIILSDGQSIAATPTPLTVTPNSL